MALEEMGIGSLAANLVVQRARERLQREVRVARTRTRTRTTAIYRVLSDVYLCLPPMVPMVPVGLMLYASTTHHG